MMTTTTTAPASSVFHVVRNMAGDTAGLTAVGSSQSQFLPAPMQPSFDVATVTFDDSGAFADAAQIDAAARLVKEARENNPNGAVDVLIHGWHHNADWTPNFDFSLLGSGRRARG